MTLIADPDGPFDLTTDYATADPASLVALDVSDPEYLYQIDDDAADDSPFVVSPFQKKYRIRLRWKRWKIKHTTPADWIAIRDQFKGDDTDQAVVSMQLYWLAHFLGYSTD